MSGGIDTQLYQVCRDEERILVKLDSDFEPTLRSPPENTAAIVVLDCCGRSRLA